MPDPFTLDVFNCSSIAGTAEVRGSNPVKSYCRLSYPLGGSFIPASSSPAEACTSRDIFPSLDVLIPFRSPSSNHPSLFFTLNPTSINRTNQDADFPTILTLVP